MKDYLRVVIPTSLCLLLANCNRIATSIAFIPMSAQFQWAPGVQGLVSSSFLWGYMATQLLAGSLADRYGAKMVMAAGVIWMSLAGFILPVAVSNYSATAGAALSAVLVCRALAGVGAGMIMPSMSSLLASSIPVAQRSSALGGAFTGFHSGNLVGLAATPFLLQMYGWPGAFFVFGACGLPVLLLWQLIVPTPSTAVARSKMVQESRKQAGLSDGPGFWEMLSKPAVLAVVIANFVNHWGYFIYLNWLPAYFNQSLGFDLRSSSMLSFLPWAVMALGSVTSGTVVDRILQSGVL